MTRRFRVLEIGSGSSPDPQADVLVDRAVTDNTERTRREELRRDGRPLVAADGAALPFADQSFELAIADSVLEHSDKPDRFLDEMGRVARRGVVVVPTTFAERVFYRPFHKFTFALDGDTLVIRPKNFPDAFGGLFDYLAHFDRDFVRFARDNRWLFNLRYEWEGRPSYRIEHYDPARPRFAEFHRAYDERPFDFRLCVSELDPIQVTRLLGKGPPVSARHRLRGWLSRLRALVPSLSGDLR